MVQWSCYHFLRINVKSKEVKKMFTSKAIKRIGAINVVRKRLKIV